MSTTAQPVVSPPSSPAVNHSSPARFDIKRGVLFRGRRLLRADNGHDLYFLRFTSAFPYLRVVPVLRNSVPVPLEVAGLQPTSPGSSELTDLAEDSSGRGLFLYLPGMCNSCTGCNSCLSCACVYCSSCSGCSNCGTCTDCSSCSCGGCCASASPLRTPRKLTEFGRK